MPCSTKMGIAAPSVGALVLALPVIILGIVIMTSSMPDVTCGSASIDKGAIDQFLLMVTWPFLVAGILGLVGGGLGAFGGLKANKNMICGSSITLGIGAGLAVIGVMATLFFAGVFKNICDDYDCDGTCSGSHFSDSLCSKPENCCNTKLCGSFSVPYTCKTFADWSCDISSKKSIATIIGIIALIVYLVASCCGCGACCCCPDSFTEMAQQKAPAAAAQGTVVGQPIESNEK